MTQKDGDPKQVNSENVGWRIGPLLIERKTSFTSLAAFIISIVAVVAILRGWLFGPELHISRMPHLYIYDQTCYRTAPGRPFLSIVAPLYLANLGEKDYSLVIREIVLTLSIAGKNTALQYEAGQLAKISENNKSPPACPQDNINTAVHVVGDLRIEEQDSFRDLLIPHGKDLRQDIIFVPMVPRNIVLTDKNSAPFGNYFWTDDFEKILKDGNFTLEAVFAFGVWNEGLVNRTWHSLFGRRKLTCTVLFDELTRRTFLQRRYVSRLSNCSAS